MSKPYRDRTPAPVLDATLDATSSAQQSTSLDESSLDETSYEETPLEQHAEDAAPDTDSLGQWASFFGTVAHDLRSPLSTITASASILADQGVSEKDRIECAGYILRSVQQMKELLEQATAMVELEAGRQPLELSARLLDDITLAAIETLASRAADAGVQVTCNVGAGLRVACNGPMLTRAFELLLGACVTSSGVSQLSVHASRVGDMVHVEVIDDGVLIPDDDIPHLFGRFWERDRGRRPHIGLAMRALDQIVRRHGGTVSAEGVADTGMRFIVSLPVSERIAGGTPGGGFVARLRDKT